MKRRTTAVLIAGAMAVSALAGCGGGAEANSDWYKEVLSDSAAVGQYTYYRTVDVNQDGVPELFLSTTEKAFVGAEDKACLMVYSAEGPKTIKEVGGAAGDVFYHNQDEKTLGCFSRLSGESHMEICELKDGELNVIKQVDYYAPHHGLEEDRDTMTYRVDGADVSEDEYNALWDTYAGEEHEITFEKIQSPEGNS